MLHEIFKHFKYLTFEIFNHAAVHQNSLPPDFRQPDSYIIRLIRAVAKGVSIFVQVVKCMQ